MGEATEHGKIFTIQKLYIASDMLIFAMILPFFVRHFSMMEIIIGYLILFLTCLAPMALMRKMHTRKMMMLGFLLRFISALIFVLPPNIWIMYAECVIAGLTINLFWTPYNIRYFNFSHKMNAATSAGHFVIVGPILNSFIPLISGLIIINFGYWYLLLLGAILFSILLYKTYNLPELKIKYNIKIVLKNSGGLKRLKFIQGFWEAGNMMIPLYTLTFIQGELAFGKYLSYLGLLGVIATLVITRISDRDQKRLKFFMPSVTMLALLMMTLPFINTIGTWAIITGLMGICATISYPFFFAIVLDKIEDKRDGMIGREFMLNSGRSLGILVVIGFVAFGMMKFAFLLFGVSLLIYPLLVLLNKVYVEDEYNPLSPVAKVYAKSRDLIGYVYPSGSIKLIKEMPSRTKTFMLQLYDGSKMHVGLKKYDEARKKLPKHDRWIIGKIKRINALNEKLKKQNEVMKKSLE